MNITVEDLFRVARDLKSEHGENPEYDRALRELCNRACGRSADEIEATARDLEMEAS